MASKPSWRWPSANVRKSQVRWLQFSAQRDDDTSTYAALLRRCGSLKTLSQGRRVHALIHKFGHSRELFLCNNLVHMYGQCSSIEDACWVFLSMPERNVFSWNLLIGAYVANGLGSYALPLYHQMQQEGTIPDPVTFVNILSALTTDAAAFLGSAKSIHACILTEELESDVIIGTALLNLYGIYGNLNEAERVFDYIHEKNVISWNALFTVYANHAQSRKSLELFRFMQIEGMIPNNVTFITLLGACVRHADLLEGKRMHVCIQHEAFQPDLMLDNCLINMYGKCGALDLACCVFFLMPERDVISWNAMVESYVQHEQCDKGLNSFQQMQMESILPDNVSFVNVLSACVSQATINEGKRVHSLTCCVFNADVILDTALVNMYAKCGYLTEAQNMFNEMPKRNVITWNAMIGAYAQHGLSNVGLELAKRMLIEGVAPNDSTFFNILCACSHTGRLEESLQWFNFMTRVCCIRPAVQHFNCMIGLLGKAGRLHESEELVYRMPCEPSYESWSAVLSSCRLHADLERAQRLIQRIPRLDPENVASFVCLSNLYAAAGRWDDADKARYDLKELPMQSCSSMENIMSDDEALLHLAGSHGHMKTV